MADDEQHGGWAPPAGASAPAQPSPPPPAWHPPPDHARPPAPTFGAAPGTDSGRATAALIFGICGVMILPIVGSIVALVLGYTARREIDASQGRITGRGSATAGIVLGWIGLVLYVLVLALIVVLVASGDFDTQDDFEFDGEFTTIVRVAGALARVVL